LFSSTKVSGQTFPHQLFFIDDPAGFGDQRDQKI
jgi:hypothetical protein